MPKKKFLIVFSEIGTGGAEKVAAGLINYLISKDFEVTILSLGPEHDYQFLALSPAAEIFHFPRTGRFDFSAFNTIKQIFESKEINQVFCIDFFAQLYIAILRSTHKLNFKIIVNLHTTKPVRYTDYAMNFLASRFLRRNDWVVFVSENQMKYISSKFLLGNPCNKKVIYNGIDTKKFGMVNDEEKLLLRQRLLTSAVNDVLIIKVAGIRIEKDHETAIKALSYFHKNFAYKPKLLLLGDGNQLDKEKLEDLCKDLDLTPYVIFLGFNQLVPQYLAIADLFTLTSFSETFSLAALEAMSCGLPAVLTAVGGASEMVNETNGGLAKPRNPKDIAEKWHATLRANLDRSTIRTAIVNQFDIQKMHANYFEFLLEVDKLQND